MTTWTRLSKANRLEQRFSLLRQHMRKALVAFVPAGDPHLAGTRAVLDTLLTSGADVIEIGFPYSDPIADGPLIQASYTRSLKNGVRVQEIFDLVADWLSSAPQRLGCLATEVSPSTFGPSALPRPSLATACPHHQFASDVANSPTNAEQGVPVVAMVSYSLVYRHSERRFVERCAQAGFSALIVPDLPAEESVSLAAMCREHDLGLIQLVAPTTPPHRVHRIVEHCSGFVYCVSVTGITGMRERLPEELKQRLLTLRQVTNLPICVGFGISRPEQAQVLQPYADGIIVGSALVAHLAEAERRAWPEVIQSIGEMTRQLRQALASPPPLSNRANSAAEQTASQ